ncbi:unnamed protein product [Effrenium voratum]|nr:unnamed protein product [Effrenium voratum]
MWKFSRWQIRVLQTLRVCRPACSVCGSKASATHRCQSRRGTVCKKMSRSPEPTATASLAQVAMRWQVQRECQAQPRAPAVLKVAEAIPGVQPPSAPGGATRLADFKPILTDLFDEGGQSNQSPQQLQAKIEQLQRLQQLLQKQQEGLKRQNQRQRQTPQGWVLWPKQSSLLLASGARGASQGSEAAKEPPAGPGVGPPPKAARDRPLNLGEAKELLKAFREIASSKDFQRTLGNIHKQGPEAVQKMQPMFVGQSFNPTMAMYDFPLTNDGYQDLAQGISKHSWNIHVKAQAHEVERLLRTPPGAFFGIPGEPGQEPNYPPLEAAPKPQPAKFKSAQSAQNPHQPHLGIEVIARHAVDNAEVRVELPKDATFLDCKRAISKVLGRDRCTREHFHGLW